MQSGDSWIQGQWVNGQGESFVSTNPANNETVWEGLSANASQVNQAVAAARQAFNPWSNTPFEQRLSYLETMRTLIEAQQNNLSLAIAVEMGKPLWEARTEVKAMIAKIALAVEAHHERTGFQKKTWAQTTLQVQHKAHGVLAIFSPFNFPAHMAHGQIVPALLAGNTVVLKPSDLTPRVAELMMQLWQETGLPDGVINLLQGGISTGQALANHSDLNGLFFTGSYHVGQQLHKKFGGHPEKLLVLEMGGNNPLIIGSIKNFQAAAYLTIQSAYLTSGQRCTCARRLLVPHSAAGDQFLEALKTLIQGIEVKAYNHDPEPFMGPLVSSAAANKVIALQSQWQQAGAVPLISVTQPDPKLAFITPGLIDVTPIEQPQDQECFGPLLQVHRYQTLEEAIHLANNTQYGLSSGIFSDHAHEYEQFLNASRAGLVNWNCPLSGARGEAPFGGIGFSGNFHPSGYYTADACAYPVSSLINEHLTSPETLTPGIKWY